MKSKTFGESAATISRDAGAAKAGNYLGYNELKSAPGHEGSGEAGEATRIVASPPTPHCARSQRAVARAGEVCLSAVDISELHRHALLLEEAGTQLRSILKRFGADVESGKAETISFGTGALATADILTPAQFAARFGRSPSFGYRQIYSGRVRTIPGMRHSIPVGEVARFAATADIYSGRSNKKKKSKGTPKQPAQSPIHPSRKEQ